MWALRLKFCIFNFFRFKKRNPRIVFTIGNYDASNVFHACICVVFIRVVCVEVFFCFFLENPSGIDETRTPSRRVRNQLQYKLVVIFSSNSENCSDNDVLEWRGLKFCTFHFINCEFALLFAGGHPDDDAEVVVVPLGNGDGSEQPQPQPPVQPPTPEPTPPVVHTPVVHTPVYTNFGGYYPSYQPTYQPAYPSGYQPGVLSYFPFVSWNIFDRVQGTTIFTAIH